MQNSITTMNVLKLNKRRILNKVSFLSSYGNVVLTFSRAKKKSLILHFLKFCNTTRLVTTIF